MRFLIFISNFIKRRYYWHFNASLYYNLWDIHNVAEFVFQIGSVGNLTHNTIYWKRWIIIARIGYVANWLMLLWELMVTIGLESLHEADFGPFFITTLELLWSLGLYCITIEQKTLCQMWAFGLQLLNF